MALANYAASGLGEKTAYLELGGHGEIAHWKPANEKGFFTDAGICYYPDFKREQIPILLNQGYEKIIMDFGDAYLSFREELLRCDQKVFLLNLNPWQKYAAKKLISTVRNEDWGGMNPLYAGVNVEETVKRSAEREYGVQIVKIPILPNPKCIRSAEFSCMNLILESAAAKAKRKPLIPIRRKK